MTKRDIKKVLQAGGILNNNAYRNGLVPSDLTAEEYVEELKLIINNKKYRKELIRENEEK